MGDQLLEFLKDCINDDKEPFQEFLLTAILEQGPDHPLFEKAFLDKSKIPNSIVIRNKASCLELVKRLCRERNVSQFAEGCDDGELAELIKDKKSNKGFELARLGTQSAIQAMKHLSGAVKLSQATTIETLLTLVRNNVEEGRCRFSLSYENFNFEQLWDRPELVKATEYLTIDRKTVPIRYLILMANRQETERLYPDVDLSYKFLFISGFPEPLPPAALSPRMVAIISEELTRCKDAQVSSAISYFGIDVGRLFFRHCVVKGKEGNVRTYPNNFLQTEYDSLVRETILISSNSEIKIHSWLADPLLLQRCFELGRIVIPLITTTEYCNSVILSALTRVSIRDLLEVGVTVKRIIKALYCRPRELDAETWDWLVNVRPEKIRINSVQGLDYLIRYHRKILESTALVIDCTYVNIFVTLELNSLLQSAYLYKSYPNYATSDEVTFWFIKSIDNLNPKMKAQVIDRLASNYRNRFATCIPKKEPLLEALIDSNIFTDKELFDILS